MKPRILFIDHTIHRSGAAISLGTLIRSLSCRIEPYFVLRKGSEVEEIIGATGHPIYFERWMPQFMTTVYTPQYPLWLFMWHVAKTPLAFLSLIRITRQWKIQLIHLNETTLIAYTFIARLLGIAVVIHARTSVAQRRFERFLLKMAGKMKYLRFIAIDEEIKSTLPTNCQRKTDLVYNPIDLGREPTLEELRAIRDSWGCSHEHVVIGQVASLHTAKGIWQILELAATLCQEYPHVRFVLIGDDRRNAGEGPLLREAIARQCLTDRVILAGYRSELSVVYGALDIALCLFSQRLGGVGRAAYEAAIAGKPLVATLPDPEGSSTLRPGATGLVFRPEDRDGILQGLRLLIESEQARRELGERARRQIGDRHLPARIASQVKGIYASLLQKTIASAGNRGKG